MFRARKVSFGTSLVAILALLSIFAAAEEPITTRMHGVLRSKGNYLLETDVARLTGTLYEGHPAVVSHIRNASSDPLLYCVLVDAGQKPEVDVPIRRAAADLIRAVAHPGDRGRAIVYGKSMKNSLAKDWDSDPAALAKFVGTPLETKGSDPYSAVVDCLEQFEKTNTRSPVIRAIFLVGGKPSEPSIWTTDWMLQRFAHMDIQLYLVSYDPGLLTGGEQKPTEAPFGGERRRRREWPPPPPPSSTAPRPMAGGWYAPSLYRVARGSAGDVIFASPKSAVDYTELTKRLRNEVELTLLASDRDANTYRDFKLTAPDIDVQCATVLYVPKR
jgi:hypothetical protein